MREARLLYEAYFSRALADASCTARSISRSSAFSSASICIRACSLAAAACIRACFLAAWAFIRAIRLSMKGRRALAIAASAPALADVLLVCTDESGFSSMVLWLRLAVDTGRGRMLGRDDFVYCRNPSDPNSSEIGCPAGKSQDCRVTRNQEERSWVYSNIRGNRRRRRQGGVFISLESKFYCHASPLGSTCSFNSFLGTRLVYIRSFLILQKR